MKRIVWLGLLIALLLVGCQEAEEVVLVETTVPTVTQTLVYSTITGTATSVSTEEQPTAAITQTPRPVELTAGDPVVKQGTALPEVEPITLENLDRLQLLAQWGFGTLYDVQLTADETQVVAATGTGFYWFDAVSLEVVDVVPYAFEANYATIQLSPTTKVAAFYDDEYCYLNFVDPYSSEFLYAVEGYSEGTFWFSPDGNFIYGLAPNKVWNVFEQEWEDQELVEFQDLDFSADGETILVNSFGELYLYTVDKEEPEQITAFDSMFWWAFDLSDDGRYIVVGGIEDVNVKVWDTVEETMIFERCLDIYGCYESHAPNGESSAKLARFTELGGPANWAVEVKFSPTGQYLTVIASEYYSSHRYLYRFDIESDMLIAKEEIPQQTQVLFSSNDRRYYTWGSTIQKRFTYEGGIAASAPQELGWKRYPLFSPDNSLIAVTSSDGNVEMLNSKTGEVVAAHNFIEGPNGYAFFHQSSQLLVGVGWVYHEPYIWNYGTNQIEKIHVSEFGWYVCCTMVSHDDQFAMFVVGDDRVYLYDLKNQNLPENQSPVFGLFHPWKPEIITVSQGKFMTYTYSEEVPNPVLVDEISAEYCDSDGYWGVSSSGDKIYCSGKNSLHIRNREGEILHSIPFWTYYATPIFSLDDSMIFVTKAYELFIFGVDIERKVLALTEVNDIHSFALSSDDKYLVIGSEDGTLRIWGVPAGE